MLNEQNEKEYVVTCDVGLTCDIIDESFYKPIIVAPTNPSCGTFTSSSSSFMKNNGRFCTSCKQVGHIEQKYMNKKSQAKVSSIKLNSFYVLTKGTNGVKAKFIGAPSMGSKKKVIWVPKSLVTNLQGPNSKFGYLKRIDLLL